VSDLEDGGCFKNLDHLEQTGEKLIKQQIAE